MANTLFLPAAIPVRRPLALLSGSGRRPPTRHMAPDLQPHPVPAMPNHTSASNYSPAAPNPAPQPSFHSSATSNETTAEGSISLAGDLSVERSVDLVEGSQDGAAATPLWPPVNSWNTHIALAAAADSQAVDDELGLAPAASSEVYVSATEDTPTSSSDGHAGSPFGDGADGEFMPGLTPRVTTFMGGPLPTVTEEPLMEDGASRQASREGSSGLLALTAQNSASVSSTPVAFGSVATQSGSLPSRASPRDAAPSSTDSGAAGGGPVSVAGSRPRSTDTDATLDVLAVGSVGEPTGPRSSGAAPTTPAKHVAAQVAGPTHLRSPDSPDVHVDIAKNAMPEASGGWLYGQAIAVVNGLSHGRDGTVDSVTEHLIQSEGSLPQSRADGAHTAPLRQYPDSLESSNAGHYPMSSSRLSTSIDLAMSKFEAERLRPANLNSGRSSEGAAGAAAIGGLTAGLFVDGRLAAATLARLQARDAWGMIGPSNPHTVTTGVPGEPLGQGSGTTTSGEVGLISETAGASTSTGNGTPRKSHDSHSDMSLVVDSEGRPMACLRNQPRLPRTAFLSTAPSAMLTANMVEHFPLSTHTTPRSGETGGTMTTVGDPTLTGTASVATSPQRGSSAFDSALLQRSDEGELRPSSIAAPEVCISSHCRPGRCTLVPSS